MIVHGLETVLYKTMKRQQEQPTRISALEEFAQNREEQQCIASQHHDQKPAHKTKAKPRKTMKEFLSSSEISIEEREKQIEAQYQEEEIAIRTAELLDDLRYEEQESIFDFVERLQKHIGERYQHRIDKVGERKQFDLATACFSSVLRSAWSSKRQKFTEFSVSSDETYTSWAKEIHGGSRLAQWTKVEPCNHSGTTIFLLHRIFHDVWNIMLNIKAMRQSKALMQIVETIAKEYDMSHEDILFTLNHSGFVRFKKQKHDFSQEKPHVYRYPLTVSKPVLMHWFRWFAHNPHAIRVYADRLIIATQHMYIDGTGDMMMRYWKSQMKSLHDYYVKYLWKITGYASGFSGEKLLSQDNRSKRHSALEMMYFYHLPLKHQRIAKPFADQVWYNTFLKSIGEPHSAKRLQALCDMLDITISACLRRPQIFQPLFGYGCEDDLSFLFRFLRELNSDKLWLKHQFSR